MSRGAAILVTGRDPSAFHGCAHSGYVRTHGLAARAAGFDVHVVCFGIGGATEETPFGTLHRIPSHIAYVRQNMIGRLAQPLAAGIAAVVAGFAGAPVLVHSFGVWSYGAAVALKRGVRPRAHLVGSYTTLTDEALSINRGLSWRSGARLRFRFFAELLKTRLRVAPLERQGYRSADRVLVNYRSVQGLVAKRFGADLRCDIVPYSIEQAFDGSAPPVATPPGPGVLCISRHDPRKGVEILLAALHMLRARGVEVQAQLIGDGVLLQAHRALAARLGLGDGVSLLGRVPSVDPYMATPGIHVLPSREEQSGSLALLEAFRTGRACIASACDGIPEDITDGENGLLVPPGDAAALADGLARLIGDAALRARLGHAGQETFRRRFSAEAMTAALGAIYDEALAPARVAA